MEEKNIDSKQTLANNYIDRLINAIANVEKIEKELKEFGNRLSYLDKCKSTIDHYIENENISYAGSRAILQEQKNILNQRRSVKQILEVLKVYDNNKNKLINSDNRKFLIAEISKKYKELSSYKYNYNEDYYTKEKLDEISKKKVVTND